ncbi:MAG: Holliday junction resolvase [Desulfurococcales archaeon]|nr:Holliday junction resolvase [Desulfurococcales archaeon]
MKGNPRKAKAARVENELANKLWEMGYAVIRGPSSGSGVRRRIHPDIVAIKKGVTLVIEVKIGHPGKPVYINKRQANRLTEFAERAGGKALIAVKIPGKGWRLHEITKLQQTKKENLKIDDPTHGGLNPTQLDEILFPKTKKITQYLKGE